jgi:hypothetical protein
MWFEVPLPFFLRDAAWGLGWERVAVGATLAVRRHLAPLRAALRRQPSGPAGGGDGTQRQGAPAAPCVRQLWPLFHGAPIHMPRPRCFGPCPALQGFIILYGQVQSWAPQLVLQPLRQSPANK